MNAAGEQPLIIGDWLVDPRDDSIARGSERIKLEPRTMSLLMHLAGNPGQVVSQEELLDSVWAGLVVSPASVYQTISQLRKALGDVESPSQYIETVARKGYRLVAKVSSAAPPAADPHEVEARTSSAIRQGSRARKIWWVSGSFLLVFVILGLFWFQSHTRIAPGTVSVVVLPFVDMTPGAGEQMFADGLTEEISNWLAQVPTLRIVARTSAFAFRERREDVRAIAKELDTDRVVEGSLRKSGNTMRITVQLIDAESGFHIWSGNYELKDGELLDTQERIARAIVSNLELRITPDVDRQLAARGSDVDEAQRLYLVARGHASAFTAEGNHRALELFRAALERDPDFSLARIGLAQAVVNRSYFDQASIESLEPEAMRLLDEVEKKSPQLVELYLARGGLLTKMRKFEAAKRDLHRALELSPNAAGVADRLGYLHMIAGEPRDALTFLTMASALDPRDYTLQGYLCLVLTDLGQLEAAEAACARARALKPESPWPYSISSALEAARGRLDEAMKWSDAALERDADIAAIHGERGMWLVRLGLLKEAGDTFRRAFETDAEGARNSPGLVLVGAAAAVDSGGAQGLKSFITAYGLDRTKNPAVQFELANASLMVKENKLARELVDRALASPAMRPEDITSSWQLAAGRSYLLIAAAAYRATGAANLADSRLDELESLLTRATDAGLRTAGLHEVRAQFAALRGEADRAMVELRKAADLGWSEVWLAEHQPYLDTLRGRQDFRALLDSLRLKNERAAAALTPRLRH
jgi:transcriptional activator of cad operon